MQIRVGRDDRGLLHDCCAPRQVELEVHLGREMRLVDVRMTGVGAMIGAGILVLTGIAAGVATARA